MTERLLNLKTLPALLVILFCTVCTSAWAGSGSCEIADTSQAISLPNINTSTTSLYAGQELGSASVTLNYSCWATGFFAPQAQLVLSDGFSNGLTVLKNAGLGMSISIGGKTIGWSDLNPGQTGKEKAFSFGPQLTTGGKLHQYQQALKVTVFVDKVYQQASTRINLHLGNVQIRAGNEGVSPVPGKTDILKFNSFSVNIIAANLIKLTLTPASIDIGYFYADYKNEAKSKPLTVTVSQANNASPGQNFYLPLMIQFGDGTKPPTADLTDSNAGLLIRNDNKELNGLKLSLTKNGNPVFFNKPEKMDKEINITNTPYDSVTGNYSVTVAPAAGQELKTGPFGVEIPVIITYN